MIRCPKILPATTLTRACYGSMFLGCASLITVPELPATTLAESCYYFMFGGCKSLTTIPNLPATTLAESCYESMFSSCTSLVETPEGWYLPAQTLDLYSFNSMFSNCSKLQKMAVSYSGTDLNMDWNGPWYLWMSGVPETGTFYYSKNQTEENIRSIVPEGWTLVQSTEW